MIRYQLLGPVHVLDNGHNYTPTAHKQRQLLALLLLNANQVVPARTCVEELWDEAPPDSAASTLQTYVLQLRRRLASLPSVGSSLRAKEILATQVYGYRLSVDPDSLDLNVFNEMASRGRAALVRHDDACATIFLRHALSMWQGEPLADLEPGRRIRTWIAGLEELRLSVQEQRIEADLRVGMHHELISELTGLIAAHSTHENFHAQLMIALYRSGRQAHALDVMLRLRRQLSTELGLEPSPRMQQLYQAVLNCDERLDSNVRLGPSPLSLDLFTNIEDDTAMVSLPSLQECLEPCDA